MELLAAIAFFCLQYAHKTQRRPRKGLRIDSLCILTSSKPTVFIRHTYSFGRFTDVHRWQFSDRLGLVFPRIYGFMTQTCYVLYIILIDLVTCTLGICTCIFLHEHQYEEFHMTFKLKLLCRFRTKQLNLVSMAPTVSWEHAFPNGFEVSHFAFIWF